MIGMRHEDKSEWEARVPLSPDGVRRLAGEHGVRFQVQRSPTRTFGEDEYAAAGAEIVESLDVCETIIGVKEIPPEQFEPNKTYMFFSHTIKGQPANMPALKRIIDLGATLIDYERIVDDQGRRLVFFGPYAGLAGMIDSFWALGRRLKHEGIDSPFSKVNPAHCYDDLEHFKREFVAIADEIRAGGLPEGISPLVCGFAGYGQVSQGAQKVFDLLPFEEVSPEDLASLTPARDKCYKVVFKEQHLVKRVDSSQPFELQEYYQHPERYEADFFRHADHLTMLVNCIYWEPKYPRLLTREQFESLYSQQNPRLRVIGDITCDIDGSLACTTHSTDPGDPIYVYDPSTGETTSGVEGNGPVVLAVDFLPCELPADASRHFSDSLIPFVSGLAKADFSGPLDQSGLPPELQRATIVYRGKLTEPYRYLEVAIREV
jgi:alpha-aminoadipic semialdehyde synthase